MSKTELAVVIARLIQGGWSFPVPEVSHEAFGKDIGRITNRVGRVEELRKALVRVVDELRAGDFVVEAWFLRSDIHLVAYPHAPQGDLLLEQKARDVVERIREGFGAVEEIGRIVRSDRDSKDPDPQRKVVADPGATDRLGIVASGPQIKVGSEQLLKVARAVHPLMLRLYGDSEAGKNAKALVPRRDFRKVGEPEPVSGFLFSLDVSAGVARMSVGRRKSRTFRFAGAEFTKALIRRLGTECTVILRPYKDVAPLMGEVKTRLTLCEIADDADRE